MKIRSAMMCASCALLMSPTWAQAIGKETHNSTDVQRSGHRSSVVHYQCEGKQHIEVAYLNIKNGDSFATLQYKRRLIPMHIAVSGSGELYIADDEQDSYRWHTKGERGMLSFLAADHTAEEETILSDCKSVKPKRR